MTTHQKNAIQVKQRPGEDYEIVLARTMLRPTVLAGVSIHKLSGEGIPDLDLQSLIDELAIQVTAANEGDEDRSVAMLAAQAHTLDAIFHSTLQKACNNFGHYPETVERYMKLALKAQSQCRTTLQAISKIKNPTIVGYVRQANIAHGAQQINNFPENELLEHQHGERLDFGEEEETGPNDSEMETVGAINGTENDGGQI